jgi:hypothetical protein
MASISIDLDWFRCPKGYRIVRSADVARAIGEHPDSYPNEDWIIPNSEERVAYRPLDENDMLCVGFAAVRTPEQLLEFIQFHGPLTSTSPQWGDSITAGLRSARRFHDLLSCSDKGRKKLAAIFNSQIRESHARTYKRDVGTPLPADYDFGVLHRWIGSADLVADPVRGVHVRIATDEFISGLWWQLGQKLSGGANIRTCRHCAALFETGPGTGRHVDANFCCDEHKVRHYSLARTKTGRRELRKRRG